jgi:hypothetical protein
MRDSPVGKLIFEELYGIVIASLSVALIAGKKLMAYRSKCASKDSP